VAGGKELMGCTKALEDVAMTRSPVEQFRSYLGLIAEGVPTLEAPARALAARYGLRGELIDAAVKDGYRALYDSYVQLVLTNRQRFEPEARTLAERFGFDAQPLDDAVRRWVQ
jgi:hypothetical protein